MDTYQQKLETQKAFDILSNHKNFDIELLVVIHIHNSLGIKSVKI